MKCINRYWQANCRLKYKMFPIEVKSGKQYKTTSLNNFREKYKERIGESYIIHPRNLIVKDGNICVRNFHLTFQKIKIIIPNETSSRTA